MTPEKILKEMIDLLQIVRIAGTRSVVLASEEF
jgi:hypothetical protein